MARSKLIIAASDTCADMLYATQFRAPDPFVFLETGRKRVVLLTDLEVDRGRSEAKVDEVVAYSEVEKSVQGSKKRKPSFARVTAAFLKSRKARRVTVPADFPLRLSKELKRENIRLRPAKGMFWPDRLLKTSREVRAISSALRVTEAGMERGIEVLKASRIRKDGRLAWGGKLLTSERLRIEIESAILRAGGEARGDTIVASGNQACDPHERGRGPLFGNQLIILDIFPRDARSGYFGDMTRTVVRGAATEEQKKLWEVCLTGQKMVLKALKPGLSGAKIHESVKTYFSDQGYATEINEGRWRGFFHGTGHGLGLEIHESPRFGSAVMQPGYVLTVEPGIYWPGVGGVRHEDVVVITAAGYRLLSNFPKQLEI